MFHGLGFTQMVAVGDARVHDDRASGGSSPSACSRRSRASGRPALVVVPVMLQRIVSLLEAQPGRYDTSSLRIVFCSGAQLEAELVRRAQRTIGDKLYNFYGSTEVAYATFATPEDLRAAPGMRRPRRRSGRSCALYDADGRRGRRAPASVGRIFVGNGFQFDGYTGGGNKEMIDGLMSTGDVGHFDADGRLFIDGRDDDMIVSGGENLFPGEVEELLITHPAIEEAAVIGVDDEEFGKRLAAFVVLRARPDRSDRGRGQGVRQAQPRALQGPARRPLPRRAAAHTRPARCSSARCGRSTRPRSEALASLLALAARWSQTTQTLFVKVISSLWPTVTLVIRERWIAMKYLRTVSTRRLLAMIAGVVAVIAAGTAIAVAAAGSGPVPPARAAGHARSTARSPRPQVQGISARISFTNHLIDSPNIQGTDPILTGATGRLWLSNDHRLRLELQSDNGRRPDRGLNNGSFWVYDPTSNTVYEGTLPARHRRRKAQRRPSTKLPSVAQIQTDIDRARAARRPVRARSRATSPARPRTPSASRPSTTAACSAPASSRGTPLTACRCGSRSTPAATARPVLELKATDISYGPVAGVGVRRSRRRPARRSSRSTPPAGHAGHGAARHGAAQARTREVTGAAAVARRLPFTLRRAEHARRAAAAVGDAAGLGRHPAALVTYGQNLGGIAVIEQTATTAGAGAPERRRRRPPAASACRRCRSTAPPARSSTPRSARWSGSPAAASATRCSARCRRRPPRPRRGRYDAPEPALTAPPPVEVRGLVKRYGELTAVAGVDLTVNAGDVYGYLGPNGAGKTTSLRMMLGLIRPTRRDACGCSAATRWRASHALEGVAGFVEAPTFYPYLTGRRNLELLAAFDGDDAAARIDEALDTVELADRAGDRVGGYSHGMRQRLGIAAALLRDPKLLLLDEPATGLDPAGMRDMRLLIRRLADEGMTVLLSSHLLAEVEEVCNRVAIVRRARSSTRARSPTLKRGAGTTYRLATTDDERALAVCRAQPGIADVRVEHGRISVHRRRGRGRRAVAGAGRGRRADPGAGAADGHARGSVLLADRGRRRRRPRRAGRRAGEPPTEAAPMKPGRRDRLPLGADQAPLPEAHLPRPRRGGRSSRSCSCSRSTSATTGRGGDFAFSSYLTRSGLAVPLVILLFGAVWMFPLITALVAGDIFASEDHNGTLKTIFTRSLERGQIFAGKALAAATYAVVAILLSGTVAVIAGQHPVGLQLAAEPVGDDRLGAEGARARVRRACSST